MTKADIRKQMKLQRNSLTDRDRALFNESIKKNLLNTTEYQRCGQLFCFVSFGSEIDTQEVLLQALLDGKEVYIPRIEENASMEFYHIDHLQDLQPSRFGVPEPLPVEVRRYQSRGKSEVIGLPLMILPGLAFDPHGNRIGYGAGYYDKFFDRYPKELFYKLGICYDFQMVEQIEAEEHDVRADSILTPARRLNCQ